MEVFSILIFLQYIIKLNKQYNVYFENNKAIIELKKQDHTIGNLITDYMKRLTIDHIVDFENNKNKN